MKNISKTKGRTMKTINLPIEDELYDPFKERVTCNGSKISGILKMFIKAYGEGRIDIIGGELRSSGEPILATASHAKPGRPKKETPIIEKTPKLEGPPLDWRWYTAEQEPWAISYLPVAEDALTMRSDKPALQWDTLHDTQSWYVGTYDKEVRFSELACQEMFNYVRFTCHGTLPYTKREWEALHMETFVKRCVTKFRNITGKETEKFDWSVLCEPFLADAMVTVERYFKNLYKEEGE